MKLKVLSAIALCMFFIACKDDAPVNQNPDNNPGTTEPSRMDMLLQKWKIAKATHDGNHDGSSTGKTVHFLTGSTYNFDGSFDGVYRWSNDSNTLFLDEGTQFEQTWTITKLDSMNFDVDFNSPFTGKPSTWMMEPYKL